MNGEITLKSQFKELKEEKNKRHPWEVHPSLELKIGLNPFIKGWAQLNIPIVTCAGVIGYVFQKACDFLGIEGDFFFRGELSLAAGIVFAMNEYAELELPNGEAKIVCTLKMGVEIASCSARSPASSSTY